MVQISSSESVRRDMLLLERMCLNDFVMLYCTFAVCLCLESMWDFGSKMGFVYMNELKFASENGSDSIEWSCINVNPCLMTYELV